MAHEWHSGILARRPAWHGLGIVRADGFRFDDADVIAETYYSVRKSPLFIEELGTTYAVPGRYALVSGNVPRHPDIAILGECADRYRIIQPATVREYVTRLVDAIPEARAETCILLRGGANAVFCVDLGPRKIGESEEIRTFLTIDSDYSGKRAVGVSATHVAVVCANTLAWAQGAHYFRIHHNDMVEANLGAALDAVEAAHDEARKAGESIEAMIQRHLDTKEEERAIAVAAKLATGINRLPDDPKERIRAERKLERFISRAVAFSMQRQNLTADRSGTLWGAYSVACEALEYDGRKRRDSLTRAMGLGDTMREIQREMVEVLQ